jgi:GNAT superfamily N-acetyltransferase
VAGNNLERMIQLAEEFFQTKNDPLQLSVTEKTMERLRQIDPSTLMEETNSDGPIAWVLLIPTSGEVMREFLDRRISEQDLLDRTEPGTRYDALYLCSALVLPEQRGQGLARGLLRRAIRSMLERHEIRALYTWTFSEEGDRLADATAREFRLPLFKRTDTQGLTGDDHG